MRILYVIDYSNLFGSELHLLDILRYQRLYNDVEVVTFRSGALVEQIQLLGIRVHTIDCYSWLSAMKIYKRLLCIIKEYGPDIVHSHQPKATFYTSIVCRFNAVKHIATIHAMPIQPASNYKFPINLFVYVFHQLVILWGETFSNRCIYVSDTARKQASLLRYKSVVIYNWVSPRFSDGILGYAKKRHAKYLCICSIAPSKGIKEILVFFKEVYRMDNQSTLTIVGAGKPKFMQHVKKLIIEYGLVSSVYMLGYQTDVEKYYSESDIFISLTKGESFGLVFVEAMSFGLPIICSDIKILKEVVYRNNLFVGNDVFCERAFMSFLKVVEKGNLSSENQNWVKSRYEYFGQQKLLFQLYNNIVYQRKTRNK